MQVYSIYLFASIWLYLNLPQKYYYYYLHHCWAARKASTESLKSYISLMGTTTGCDGYFCEPNGFLGE